MWAYAIAPPTPSFGTSHSSALIRQQQEPGQNQNNSSGSVPEKAGGHNDQADQGIASTLTRGAIDTARHAQSTTNHGHRTDKKITHCGAPPTPPEAPAAANGPAWRGSAVHRI